MSTYLVAFVICDYEHVNTNSDRGFPVTVYTPPTFTSQAFFALNITTHIMDYYADFFMVPYPLPKQGNKIFSVNFVKNRLMSLILWYLCRSCYNTRLCNGCNGELGIDHVPWVFLALWSRGNLNSCTSKHRSYNRARARTPGTYFISGIESDR